jgi:hypothetical protein
VSLEIVAASNATPSQIGTWCCIFQGSALNLPENVKESVNVIKFSLPNGLDSLKVCHEYLPLKYLAKGKPNEQVKPTPVAAVVKHGLQYQKEAEHSGSPINVM